MSSGSNPSGASAEAMGKSGASPGAFDSFVKSMGGQQGMMGLAQGFLQAAGPSRMPTSLGQAMASGMDQSQKFRSNALQNQMAQIQLDQAKQSQDYFNQFYQPQASEQQNMPDSSNAGSTAAQAGAIAAGVKPPPVDSSMQPPTQAPQAQQAPQQAAPQQRPPQQPPMQPQKEVQLPPQLDPTTDPEYQKYMRQAQVDAHFKIDPQPDIDRANARLDALKNKWQTLDDSQAALVIPNYKPVPGVSVQYKPYTGEWKNSGDPRYKDVTWQDNNGMIVHGRMDQSTGQVSEFKGTQPLTAQPGDLVRDTPDGQVTIPKQYVSMARAIAAGDQNMPTNRYPKFTANLTSWVKALNPAWTIGDAPSKVALMKSASAGPDAKFFDAGNTIQSHLGTLRQALDALHNGDIQSANKLINWAGAKFGKDDPTNAKVAETIVTRELGKLLSAGGQMTDADKAEASSTVNTDMANKQYNGAIDYIQMLIGGKMNATLKRYQANGLDKYFKARLEDDALNALESFQASQKPSNAQPIGNGWSVQVH